jgi:hypothetical protein
MQKTTFICKDERPAVKFSQTIITRIKSLQSDNRAKLARKSVDRAATFIKLLKALLASAIVDFTSEQVNQVLSGIANVMPKDKSRAIQL